MSRHRESRPCDAGASALDGVARRGPLPRAALDVRGVVAARLEGFHDARRSPADLADDVECAVGQLVEVLAERRHRQVHGSGHVAGLELVRLAHVDEGHVRALAQFVDGDGLHGGPPVRRHEAPVRRQALGVLAAYFLLRRWWRVLRSSLRCFFFAMRLRRFLMTEPTENLTMSGSGRGAWRARDRAEMKYASRQSSRRRRWAVAGPR